jgi:hypothetical protein
VGIAVTATAQLQCAFGAAPAVLNVAPANRVMVENKPMANIMDNKPNVNIPPFGMCNTLSNPQVASATSAAQGVLTPQPCLPVITAPWTPGAPTVMVGNQPALNNSSQCLCQWGGAITITNPGATRVMVP